MGNSSNGFKPPFHEYLGDGVYVEFNGWSIVLKANDSDNPTDTIMLEGSVLEALDRYTARIEEYYAAQGPHRLEEGDPDA